MNYETAAFLAQHLKPEQLFANAAAFITAVLNGDFNPDSLSFDAQASVTPVAATAPQVEAPTSQAQPENVQYTEIRKLGTYPVVSDADMTPADEGKTKVEKGFEDTTDNGINDSPIEKSARAAAMKFFNGDVEEVERFMKWFHENQQYYVDGSHQQGYSKDGFRDVFVEKGEAVMGERNGGAKDVKINFDKPEQATRGTYVTSDGVRVNADVYDTCANPQLSMAEPEKPAPAAPAEAVCEPTKTIDIHTNDGTKDGDVPYPQTKGGEVVPVVRMTGMEPDAVWQDKNGDGDMVRKDSNSPVGVSWDRGEVLPGLSEDKVQKDVDALRAAGYKGNVIVYEVTDCNGKTVIACWDIEKKEWGLAYPDDHNGNPYVERATGKKEYFDRKAELAAYLRNTDRVSVPVVK